MAVVRHKEAIHSGHFMISDFDAEVEADEDIVSHPPAAEDTETNCPKTNSLPQLIPPEEMETSPPPSKSPRITKSHPACKASKNGLSSGTNGISWGKGISMRSSSRFVTDVSLKKLLQSMTIAYRHKLTSPKWNKFRGLRLRWKDKIRLNNVIWRCWHLQFIRGKKHILCKFANPLEIDNHNRVESGTLLEGKYWKRKLRAVMQEYKRWRMFYKNQGRDNRPFFGGTGDDFEKMFSSGHNFQIVEGSKDDNDLLSMGDDFFIESFLSSLPNTELEQADQQSHSYNVPFPHPRDFHKTTTNADFIQPGLAQLQPNLEDFFMEIEGENLLEWLPGGTTASTATTSNTNTTSVTSMNQKPTLNSIPENNDDQIKRPKAVHPQQQQHHIQFNGQHNHMMADSARQQHQLQFEYQQKVKIVSPKHRILYQRGGKPHHQQQLNSLNQEQQMQTMTPPPSSALPMRSNTSSSHRHSPYSRMLPSQNSAPSNLYNNGEMNSSVPTTNNKQSNNTLGIPEHKKIRSHSGPAVQQHFPTTMQQQQLLVQQQQQMVQTSSNISSSHQLMNHQQQLPRSSSTNSQLVQLLRASVAPSNNSGPQGADSPISVGSSALPHDLSLRGSTSSLSNGIPSIPAPPPPVQQGFHHYRQKSESGLDAFDTNSINSQVSSLSSPSIARSPMSANEQIRHFSGLQSQPSPLPLQPPPPPQSPMETKPQISRGKPGPSTPAAPTGTLQNGFDQIRALLPDLKNNSSAKISKAALLTKGADYLQGLMSDNKKVLGQIKELQDMSKMLNDDIRVHLGRLSGKGQRHRLPSVGHSSAANTQEDEEVALHYENHVRRCSAQNYKYWVFAYLMNPLLKSFNAAVSQDSMEDLRRTSMSWLDQACSANNLRTSFLSSMVEFSKRTEVLDRPHNLAQEVATALNTRELFPEGKSTKDEKNVRSQDGRK